MSEQEKAVSADVEMEEEQVNSGDDEARVYEAGVHVIPTLGEEGAVVAFNAIRDRIMKAGGAIIAEEAPTLVTLVYKMQKDIDRKRTTYTTAYFGWVKFEAAPDVAHKLKAFIAEEKNVLRSLLIKTTRETFARQLPVAPHRGDRPIAPEAPERAPEEKKEKVESPMTVEALDAEIEKLIVE